MEAETIIRGVVTKTSVFADLIALQTHQSEMYQKLIDVTSSMAELVRLLSENGKLIDELERTIDIDNEYSKSPL